MITVAEAVKNTLQNSFFIEEALTLGIINLSSLARFLKPEIEHALQKKVESGAIVMALKRHSLGISGSDRKLRKWLQQCPDLLARSNLVELTFANSDTILGCQKRFLEEIEERRDSFFTFTRGLFETTVIAGKSLKGSLQNAFRKEKLLASYENLSAISLQLAEGTALVPGFYSFILKALFCQGINVTEVVSTLDEFTLIFQDEFAGRAFATLKALMRR